LVIVHERDVAQRFEQLLSAIVDTMRASQKRNHQVAIRRLVEQHLRVAGADNLAVGLFGKIGEQVVNLALAQDLKVRIWLINQEDRARVGFHIRQQE
jgi:phosphoglycerate dehydrogenase-like enzyme